MSLPRPLLKLAMHFLHNNTNVHFGLQCKVPCAWLCLCNFAALGSFYSRLKLPKKMPDSHTTNLVDVNWTVNVINKLKLPPMLLMTLSIPPPVHHREHSPPWQMDTNYRRYGV